MKTYKTICTVIVLAASASTTANTQPRAPADNLRVILRAEPRLEQVRAAALRYAGLHKNPWQGWTRRARLAGLLPVLTLRTTSGAHEDEDLSRASTGTQSLKRGNDRDFSFEVKAVWRLDRLLFDSSELRAVEMAQRLRRTRRATAAQVTSLFFERRRLVIEWFLASGSQRTTELNIATVTAQLDALTGGYYRQALRKCCRNRSPGL